MLDHTFGTLLRNYGADEMVIYELWQELSASYSQPQRYYHNLDHLEDLYGKLRKVSGEVKSLDAVLFALFYHDFIYDVSRNDNEERSAAAAAHRMQRLSCAPELIEASSRIIIATLGHSASQDSDVNLFTDADLSILGAEEEDYMDYAARIRKEYSIYPDELYKPGRKKVLEHFLAMPQIFKTAYFFTTYEDQARLNLRKELTTLS